jgi:hypothetical protein
VGNALAGRALVIAAVDGARETAVDGTRDIVVEGACAEDVPEVCLLWTAVLDAARGTDFEVVTLIAPGRMEVGRETACGPDLRREVAARVEWAIVDAARLVLSGTVFFHDEGARVTPDSGFSIGLTRVNGLSSSDCTRHK